jgi:hypothetical protein
MKSEATLSLLLLAWCPAICPGQERQPGLVYAWGENVYGQTDVLWVMISLRWPAARTSAWA